MQSRHWSSKPPNAKANNAHQIDGEHIRAWMTGRFEEALTETGRRFVVLHGPVEERLGAALVAVDGLLAEGWGIEGHTP